MFSRKNIFLSKGLSLVEVVIATSIILVFFMALVGVYNTYIQRVRANIDTVKAIYLTEEGIEAVKFLRDSGWTANITPLTIGSNYYLNFSGGMWKTTTSNIYTDGVFERKLVFQNASRDPVTSDIVTSGGTVDNNLRLVTVSVSWLNHGATTTKSISTYITNLFTN